LISGLIAAARKRQVERREKDERTELRRQLTEWRLSLGPVSVGQRTTELPSDIVDELIARAQEQIADRIASRPGGDLVQVKEELTNELVEFRDRIAKIEGRFPPDADLDKVASINDALLSERIDQLTKRLEGVEARILSKWDVALVVSAILGGISAVVAATVAVVRFLGGA
tara:strand:+ start:439 stop:951 length:513 start_codon:yes stop_codon:yes gene_type:complete